MTTGLLWADADAGVMTTGLLWADADAGAGVMTTGLLWADADAGVMTAWLTQIRQNEHDSIAKKPQK